jgi:uncharacterized protein involved in exopolysaccharide biosynthesis
MTGTRVPPSAAEAPKVHNADSYVFITRNDGVSVRELLLFLWRSRWFALIGAVVCASAAIAASMLATPRYTATVAVMPAGRTESLGSLGSAVSQLSGIASLAGINMGAAGGMKAEALATLQSEVLTDEYIREHNLLPVLFSSRWDPATRTWRRGVKVPTLWEANQLFQAIRVVEDNAKTGLVTITVRWADPYTAAAWANGLVKLTNDYLRQKSIDEADRSIAYLSQEVSKTNIVEVKNAIYGLMENEIKKEMVARGREDFALRVIDPAVPPEKKSYPRPLLWTAGGIVLGIFLGLLASILRETMMDEGMERNRGAGKAAAPVHDPAISEPGIERL